MGTLYPDTATLSSIDDPTERHVVDLLVRRLDDDWLILPNYRVHYESMDHEIDVIVIHPRCGVAIIEVKGGTISIVKGQWFHNGDRSTPDEQALHNSFALRHLLSEVMPEKSFKVAWGLALPRIAEVRGALPGSLCREQLLLSPDFEDLNWRIETLFDSIHTRYDLDSRQLERILNRLCPDAEFVDDPQAQRRRTREQLDTICEARVDALRSLDINHRVLVTGRAGTGKTYLAIRWAQSGMISDDEQTPKRVLLTCYNDPLGFELQKMFKFDDDDEPDPARPFVRVGPFLKIALQLEGLPTPPFEETNDWEYWVEKVPAFLRENWHLVTEKYDRIVVDEAQDFSPEWLRLLETLLDPDGDDTFLMVGDSHQQLIDRGFVAPPLNDGWVHAHMSTNVRSSRDIALLARRFLDGATAPTALPSSQAIASHEASDEDSLVDEVRNRIGAALRDATPTSQILVVSNDSHVRDRLRHDLQLGRAELRHEGVIPCETAHRAKGLEASVVIVAVGPGGIDDGELYVAITRAVNELHIVAPRDTLQRLALAG